MRINILKAYRERELEVCSLTVVADEKDVIESGAILKVEECEGYSKIDLFAVLGEFGDVLSEEPGRTNVVKADIRLLPETPVISQRPYRLPDRLKEPVKN